MALVGLGECLLVLTSLAVSLHCCSFPFIPGLTGLHFTNTWLSDVIITLVEVNKFFAYTEMIC